MSPPCPAKSAPKPEPRHVQLLLDFREHAPPIGDGMRFCYTSMSPKAASPEAARAGGGRKRSR